MAEQGCEKHGHINCSACADEAELTRLRATIEGLRAELEAYKAQTLAALQWAGEFQDGAFAGVLELGDSCIVKGGEWLVAEVKRLRADVARLTRERDRWYKAAHDGIDNVAEALSRTEQELAAERQRARSNADATLKAQRDDCHERRAEAERRAEQAAQREARLKAALEWAREELHCHAGNDGKDRTEVDGFAFGHRCVNCDENVDRNMDLRKAIDAALAEGQDG